MTNAPPASLPLVLSILALAASLVALALAAAALRTARRAAGLAGSGRGLNAGDEIDPETLAVLAAAAAAALGSPVVVHRVHAGTPVRAQETWSRAGRLDIMVSHRLGPGR